jgi:hypothetical protein
MAKWQLGSSVGKCVKLHGVDIDLGARPLLLHALAGRLDGIRARVKTADVNGMRLRDVDVRLQQIAFNPWLAPFGKGNVRVKDGRARVHVAPDDITAYAQAQGLPFDVELRRQAVVFRLTLPLVAGLALPTNVGLKDGAIVVTPDAAKIPSIMRLLLPPEFVVRPAPDVRLTRLTITPSGVDATAAFTGENDLNRTVCG